MEEGTVRLSVRPGSVFFPNFVLHAGDLRLALLLLEAPFLQVGQGAGVAAAAAAAAEHGEAPDAPRGGGQLHGGEGALRAQADGGAGDGDPRWHGLETETERNPGRMSE